MVCFARPHIFYFFLPLSLNAGVSCGQRCAAHGEATVVVVVVLVSSPSRRALRASFAISLFPTSGLRARCRL